MKFEDPPPTPAPAQSASCEPTIEPCIVAPRRRKAPRDHGQFLAIPDLAEMPRSVERNRGDLAEWDFAPLGRPIHELRELARREALAAAVDYTQLLDSFIDCESGGSRNREISVPQENTELAQARLQDPSRPLIVSGHQPELFHCGVWVKNFVLDHMASAMNGIGLNLIIDNDALPISSIAVPVGGRDAPSIEQIPFAEVHGNPPWEEVRVCDEPLFRSFAERVTTVLSDWSLPPPLLNQMWPAACAVLDHHADQRAYLVNALTVARRAVERTCGLQNLELPISRLAGTEAFAWFVAWMLADVTTWHTAYNGAVESHRRTNRIRSVSHPVPNLIRDTQASGDERFEVPLWIWQTGASRRSRLFVRDNGVQLRLFAESEELATLPHPARTDPARTIASLRSLATEKQVKIRPRALTNTLFARVFLGDTFLHGIGGAKYDEITDQLIAKLCNIRKPPEFLTVTATFQLPLGAWDVKPADVAEMRHRLWDFDHNSERHIVPDNLPIDIRCESKLLLTERRQLIEEEQTKSSCLIKVPDVNKAGNLLRCRRLRDIRRRLAELVSTLRILPQTEWQLAQSRLVANTVLSSREFSIGLFSSDLPQQLAQILRQTKSASEK